MKQLTATILLVFLFLFCSVPAQATAITTVTVVVTPPPPSDIPEGWPVEGVVILNSGNPLSFTYLNQNGLVNYTVNYPTESGGVLGFTFGICQFCSGTPEEKLLAKAQRILGRLPYPYPI